MINRENKLIKIELLYATDKKTKHVYTKISDIQQSKPPVKNELRVFLLYAQKNKQKRLLPSTWNPLGYSKFLKNKSNKNRKEIETFNKYTWRFVLERIENDFLSINTSQKKKPTKWHITKMLHIVNFSSSVLIFIV